MSQFDSALEGDLLTQDFKNMYTHWMDARPDRSGMHASAVLDKEFCAREQVLHELWPEQGERSEVHHWDWKKSAIFENGWRLHQRWQDLFKKCGNVVYSLDQHGNLAPELDLTHYDADRNLYFSPDAIIMFGGVRYVVEIKGIKEQSYLELTDDLEQACQACETVHKAREQCNLYCHMLLISRGIILVENKNTCDFKVWVIEYDQERAWPYTSRMNEVKGRTLLVKQHGRGKLPPRCCASIQDTRARKCPMKKLCFQESEDW